MSDENEFPASIEEWRRLGSGDREFYVWQTLSRSYYADKRFARKWVESALISVAVIILTSFLYAIVNYVIPARSGASKQPAAAIISQ